MKKKWENLWYYGKWYFLAGLLVIFVAVDFLGDIRDNRPSDGVVSIVTMSQIPEESAEKIRELFQELWGDRNRDGYVEIEVNVYGYDGMGNPGRDTEAYAAAAVHLASEIRGKTTDLFLSDAGELMEEAESLQCYGVWRDYEKLNRLDCDGMENFGVYAFPEKAEAVLGSLG